MEPLQVPLKYAYPHNPKDPGSNIVYQRPVPADVMDRYLGKTIKHDLKTANIMPSCKQISLSRR